MKFIYLLMAVSLMLMYVKAGVNLNGIFAPLNKGLVQISISFTFQAIQKLYALKHESML